MSVGVMSDAEARRLVGAVYCPTCRQETLPLPSGLCGWCDTRLAEPGEEPGAALMFCEHCDALIEGAFPANKRFCSTRCKKLAWDKTEAGQRERARRRAAGYKQRWRDSLRARREAAREHGTNARYDDGCRCQRCRGSHYWAVRKSEAAAGSRMWGR